jgi:hypothetical protein
VGIFQRHVFSTAFYSNEIEEIVAEISDSYDQRSVMEATILRISLGFIF